MSAAHSITEKDLREESSKRAEAHVRLEIARRSIEFAGQRLDTKADNFLEQIQAIAQRCVEGDPHWLDRSARWIRLATFDETDLPPASSGGLGGTYSGQRGSQAPEALRETMGLMSEWLAFKFLKTRHPEVVDEDCWVSTNRARFYGGSPGDDTLGYDFRVVTPNVEWLYEVKSALDEGGEFELTANEIRMAASAGNDGKRRYRILYVPFVFDPARWCVFELPNPMSERTRNQFRTVGRGSVRLRFERR